MIDLTQPYKLNLVARRPNGGDLGFFVSGPESRDENLQRHS